MSRRKSGAKARRPDAEDDDLLNVDEAPAPIKVARLAVLDELEAAFSAGASTHVDASNLTGEERVIVKTVAQQLAKSAFETIRSQCYEDSNEPEPVDRALARKVSDLRRDVTAAVDDVVSLRQQYERLLPQQVRETLERRSTALIEATRADIDAASAELAPKHTGSHRPRTRSQLQTGLDIAVEEAEDIGLSLAAQSRVVDAAFTEATNTVAVMEAVDRAARAPSTVDVALRTGAETLAAGAAEIRRGRAAK